MPTQPVKTVSVNKNAYSETTISTNVEEPIIIHTKVAGVSKRNADGESRQKLIRDCIEPGQVLLLKPEPENEFDPYAIGVWWHEGVQIGYVRGEDAKEIAEALAQGKYVNAMVTAVTGGTEQKYYRGVNMDLYITDEPIDIQVTVKGSDEPVKKSGWRTILILFVIIVVLCLVINLINLAH